MTKSNNRPRLHANFQDLMAHSKSMPNGCIEWQSGKGSFGYGAFRINGASRGTHRLALSLIAPQPFEGAVAMHICDNPPCINPNHLRWGTASENSLDRHSKGRSIGAPIKGQQVNTCKLNEELVRQIRNDYASGMKSPALALKYQIGSRQILHIVRRQSWKWVD